MCVRERKRERDLKEKKGEYIVECRSVVGEANRRVILEDEVMDVMCDVRETRKRQFRFKRDKKR